jgi:hypothetical protein
MGLDMIVVITIVDGATEIINSSTAEAAIIAQYGPLVLQFYGLMFELTFPAIFSP